MCHSHGTKICANFKKIMRQNWNRIFPLNFDRNETGMVSNVYHLPNVCVFFLSHVLCNEFFNSIWWNPLMQRNATTALFECAKIHTLKIEERRSSIRFQCDSSLMSFQLLEIFQKQNHLFEVMCTIHTTFDKFSPTKKYDIKRKHGVFTKSHEGIFCSF